ncbi:hypothetical protein NB696_004024 [Xanthomonas sacchari]|nr:hypothetical protein [Xanthomonas sacchari]
MVPVLLRPAVALSETSPLSLASNAPSLRRVSAVFDDRYTTGTSTFWPWYSCSTIHTMSWVSAATWSAVSATPTLKCSVPASATPPSSSARYWATPSA